VSLLALPIALLSLAPDSSRLPDSTFVLAPPAPIAVVARRPRLAPRLLVPAAFFGYGLLTKNSRTGGESRINAEMREEVREQFPAFRTHIDDYTRHAPLVAAYLLPLAGVKGQYNAVDFSLIYLSGHVLNTTLTSNLKRIAGECRPGNASDHSSFPSAHTSQAFFTATLLHEQYRQQSPWISVGGYALATATGAMRMLNDRHWLSDVAAGAGIGILSAEVAWRVYPWFQKRVTAPIAKKVMVLPMAGPRTAGLTVMLRPR
jgi:hypothetical protein